VTCAFGFQPIENLRIAGRRGLALRFQIGISKIRLLPATVRLQ
jgi:hypothetical protein